MTAAERQHHMQAMRDLYQGEHPPAVAELHKPARLLSIRAAGRVALVLIDDAGTARLIRASRCDEPGLERLSPSDRARVASAVHALHREACDAAA